MVAWQQGWDVIYLSVPFFRAEDRLPLVARAIRSA